MWLSIALPPEENDECKESSNDGRQRRSGIPRVLNTSPGQADEEASHATNEDEKADPISLLQLLGQGDLGDSVETYEHNCDDEANATERIIYMETPTP